MRIIRFALAISAMVCLAATSTLARDANESISSTSKPRSSKQAKTSSSKNSASKRKAKAKASRAKAEKNTAARRKEAAALLPDMGDVDMSGTFWKNLPLEKLPTYEPAEIDEEPTP